MKIGIIGSGHIGATAARLLVTVGHEVALSNSRGGEGLQEDAPVYNQTLNATEAKELLNAT